MLLTLYLFCFIEIVLNFDYDTMGKMKPNPVCYEELTWPPRDEVIMFSKSNETFRKRTSNKQDDDPEWLISMIMSFEPDETANLQCMNKRNVSGIDLKVVPYMILGIFVLLMNYLILLKRSE